MAGQQLPIMYPATADYMCVMGVSLVSGRLVTENDKASSQLVAVINQTMANDVWPGQNPIGKCFRSGLVAGKNSPIASPTLPCREVVGVVRDSRARSLRTDGHEAKLSQYYIPFEQVPSPGTFAPADAPSISGIIVSTTGSPATMIAPVQRLIQGSSTLPVYADVRLYQDLLDPQLRPLRLGASLFSLFAVLALCIAIVGLYAVTSFAVAERTKEMGVRMALGGTSALIGRLVVTDALRTVGIGIAAGLVLALSAAPLVQSMLFETSARETSIVLAAGALLLLVSVVAAAVPAWRAAQVNPMVSLDAD